MYIISSLPLGEHITCESYNTAKIVAPALFKHYNQDDMRTPTKIIRVYVHELVTNIDGKATLLLVATYE